MAPTLGPVRRVNATRDLPPRDRARIAAGRPLRALNDWYQAVLGVDPYLLNEWFSFRRLRTDYPYTQVLATSIGRTSGTATADRGLDDDPAPHGSLGAMFDRYERLKAIGIDLDRSMTTARRTSFDYRDPDGNAVELIGARTSTPRPSTWRTSTRSTRTATNISGIAVDPDTFVAAVPARDSSTELVRV